MLLLAFNVGGGGHAGSICLTLIATFFTVSTVTLQSCGGKEKYYSEMLFYSLNTYLAFNDNYSIKQITAEFHLKNLKQMTGKRL